MDRVIGETTGATYALSPRALIGRGAEGRVFSAGGGSDCVKVLDAPLDDGRSAALAALGRVARKVPGFAWPTELVKDPATGDRIGFAMPLARGRGLEALMDGRETGAIPVLTKARLALALARAVAAAHEHRGPRIVLGDVLKSANLLIDGEACTLVDAGSVSVLGFRARGGEVRDSVSRVNTPGYNAPEVLRNPGATPSHDSDNFALAVLLFELLFGRPPHEPRSCPGSVGLDPDECVRRGLFLRYVSDPEFTAPTYDAVQVPDDVDRLFRAAFLATAMRPAAGMWCDAIERWIEGLTPRPPLVRRIAPVVPPWARSADRIVAYLLAAWIAAYGGWRAYVASVTPRPEPPAPRRVVGPPLFQEIFK